ncbi:MAG: amidohydrolase family protein [Cytophagaceae bacterium]|jgi:dihydroorotase-like cyclic amidohydrolase|nr:amidohydrolase family protein [Cytophagaceae bacterium]
MKYLLLKNGYVVQNQELLQKDVLIGNNRIIEIGTKVRVPLPDSQVIDVTDRYLLPGLIHYDSPFLKGDPNESSSSAIYIALSHGATFLLDTVKLKKEIDYRSVISYARDGNKPIITDYGFHLRAFTEKRASINDLINIFILEGITSYVIKWKDIEKLDDDNLDELFAAAAKYRLLIICESPSASSDDMETAAQLNKSDWEKYRKILSIIHEYKCTFLFLNITLKEELNFLLSNSELNKFIYASVHLNCKEKNSAKFGFNDLNELWQNRNILLAPPYLKIPNSKSNHFIENSKSSSFLSNILCNNGELSQEAIVKVCEMYAARPAQLLGIYPQKGILERGADADIIVWDPSESNILKLRGTNTSLLRKDINAVIINGKMINDEVYEIPSHLQGRYIYRNIILPVNSASQTGE